LEPFQIQALTIPSINRHGIWHPSNFARFDPYNEVVARRAIFAKGVEIIYLQGKFQQSLI
jgi:hypothetical protein